MDIVATERPNPAADGHSARRILRARIAGDKAQAAAHTRQLLHEARVADADAAEVADRNPEQAASLRKYAAASRRLAQLNHR